MKRTVLVLLAAARQLAASDLHEPSDFLKIMEESKVIYKVDKGPVAHPVELFTCSRRDSTMQRYVTAKGFTMENSPRTPEAKLHFDRAEAFFKDKKLEDAAREYKETIAAEPDCAVAWLFLGDIPFGKRDWEAALADYQKASAIDDSNAQAHRFEADVLAHLGRYVEAEDEYIYAIARDPQYKEAWKALEDLGKRLGFRIEHHAFVPPEKFLGRAENGDVEIGFPTEGDKLAGRWLTYATCKAVWRFEPGFREKRGAGEGDSRSELSLSEERECVANYIEGGLSAVASERADKKLLEAPLEVLAREAPADVGFLYDVMTSGMLDGLVLFEDMGRSCPFAISMLDKSSYAEIEKYIRKFVVVHVGPVRGEKSG